MTTREKVQYGVRAIVLTIIFTLICAADIVSQMKFTEDTRAGLYEASYQRTMKGGAP